MKEELSPEDEKAQKKLKAAIRRYKRKGFTEEEALRKIELRKTRKKNNRYYD